MILWRLLRSGCDGAIYREVGKTALIALTAATLLTDLVTLGVRYSPFEPHTVPDDRGLVDGLERSTQHGADAV